MKKQLLTAGLLALLSFCSSKVIAQNYQPFRKGLTYHFTSQDSIYSMRIDTAKIVGGDSVFVFNQTVKKVNKSISASGCTPPSIYAAYQIQNNNQFGSQVIKKQNGDYVFQTSQGQDFLIKTKAAIGQSWTFNVSQNITATLAAKTLEPVLTTSDSAFTYSLSNGNQIKLSKNYGFILSPNFVSLADPYFKPKTLQFHALPEKGLGKAISSPFSIYDFQVGDKFSYHTEEKITFLYQTNLCSEDWNQYKVLTRRDSPKGDSIYYILEHQGLHKAYGSPSAPSPMCQQTGIILYPTVTDTLIITKNTRPELNALSHGFYAPPSGSAFQGAVSTGIFRSTCNQRFISSFENLPYTDCAEAFSNQVDQGNSIQYGMGLGKVYSLHSSISTDNEEKLEAYVKGTETCGTWRTIAQIMGTKSDKDLSPAFSTYPNPFNNQLSIKFSDTFIAGNTTVSVLNVLGQEVVQQQVTVTTNQEIKLNMPEMAKGLYIMKVSQNGKTYTSRLVKE